MSDGTKCNDAVRLRQHKGVATYTIDLLGVDRLDAETRWGNADGKDGALEHRQSTKMIIVSHVREKRT